MKRFFIYLLYIIIAIVLVTIAVSNPQSVTVKFLPDWFPLFGGVSVTLPLFVHIYIALFEGLALGLLIEYVREARFRRQARKAKKELKKTEQTLQKTKKDAGQHDDEVLAIVGE